ARDAARAGAGPAARAPLPSGRVRGRARGPRRGGARPRRPFERRAPRPARGPRPHRLFRKPRTMPSPARSTRMKKPESTCKYIVVTGGVLSGLGKGIAAASIGNLLSGRLKVVPVKCDGYLNTDPGTMNPIEHGEVFVLDDGGEVDMDFGHYERFMDVNAKFHWNLTMGKVFKSILEKERRGDYLGKTVQFLPHVTDRIKEWFREIAEEEKADVMLIEVGGTVGDLENQFYLEAVRQLKRDVGPGNVIYIHLTYVPVPEGVNEQKSKPTQTSVRLLNEKGIEPDVVIGRCK